MLRILGRLPKNFLTGSSYGFAFLSGCHEILSTYGISGSLRCAGDKTEVWIIDVLSEQGA